MNTIKTLLLLSFSILLFNCSDEEDKKTEKEFIFSASELKQTEWEGGFLYLTNGEIDSKGSIKIVFYTEKKGVCEYKLCTLMVLFLFMEIGYNKNTTEIL